jgi:guanylate kinase
MLRQVVVIAGPAGSGKDSIIRGVMAKYPKAVFGLTSTTRAPRPGEQHGVNYFFFSNEEFLKKVENGDVPEHYHRAETDTYYGLYKPYLDEKVAEGKIVFYQIQISGAKYLKEHYDATTIFIMPPSMDAFEKRLRERAPMTDAEWNERREHTRREIEEDAPFYDYQIANEDGKLDEAIERVVEILKKEGYTLA